MERLPQFSQPVMFDKAIMPLRNALADNISWLDHIFGFCEMLTDVKDGRKWKSANVYAGKDEYVQVMPCNELGNFCFFLLREPQEFRRNDKQRILSPFSAIFWYDVSKVSSSVDERNLGAITAQIMGVFNSLHGLYEIDRIYNQPESIFKEFSYDHTNNQFLMHPYAGLRIDGTIWCDVPCVEQNNI